MTAKSIRVTIATNPVAKGRPRVAFRNGKIWSYNPHKTENAQNFIMERLMRHKDKCFAKNVPVKLTLVFYRIKSKSLPKRETLPFRKPDLDNFAKLVCDAINGILIVDDAQITTMILRKRWANDGKGHIAIKLEGDRNGIPAKS